MRTSRRRFLCAAIGACGAGLGYAAWQAAQRVGNRKVELPAGLSPFTRASRALGTEVSITALHAQRDVAERAVAAAFAELELVEELMSIYRPHSQLSRLNRDGYQESPHPYLLQVLNAAARVSRHSHGAFDVTVQPLWALYADAHKRGTLPDAAEVEAARQKVDWRRLEISRERVGLLRPGMAVTLNGIAQGFATDQALGALKQHGIAHALVNAGEIGALGCRPDGDLWTVGIQHPREPDAYISLAKLQGRALATSGDYATSFTPDRAYNHIFDPRTGRSPQEFASVSIAAPTSMEADALSTAVFVAGVEPGLKLIESSPGADAFFVLKSGRTLATKGFPLET
jgi:thiamine biosynthesis lipoprotein